LRFKEPAAQKKALGEDLLLPVGLICVKYKASNHSLRRVSCFCGKQMNNVNPSALLRTLVVYAVCVPLAMLVGYLLSDPFQQGSMMFGAAVAAVLIFPLLMKWHYPLLILSFGLPVTMFFLPGRPNMYLTMVAASLTITVLERILDRNQPSLPVPSVRWPLLALLAVVFATAKLTGGFGLRSMGSDVYGGKKYIFLVVGILAFFAVSARPISKKQANLYITLYFAGGFLAAIQDLYPLVPSPLRFIYLVIPPANFGMGELGSQGVVLGQTRLGGMGNAASAVFFWMLARHGFRGNFLTGRIWRPLIAGLAFSLIFLGGFRSGIISAVMVLGLIFFLEKMHRTGAMLVVLMAGLLGGAVLVPLASHLPYTFQRALTFLPLDLSNEARMDAEDSSQWRINIWKAELPLVPKYLLLGKGYAFSAETFNESMGLNATFQGALSAADNPLALSSDFHSGPLSVVIPLGIWGALVWLWFWGAGFLVLWRNYHYGDPDLRHINLFLYAFFLQKCVMFLFVVGSMVDDVGVFAGVIGLSVAFNHGVRRRKAAAVWSAGQTASPARPALGRPAAPSRPALPAVG